MYDQYCLYRTRGEGFQINRGSLCVLICPDFRTDALTNVLLIRVANPDPDPVGSGMFCPDPTNMKTNF